MVSIWYSSDNNKQKNLYIMFLLEFSILCLLFIAKMFLKIYSFKQKFIYV